MGKRPRPTRNNYYTSEMDSIYFSASQVKSFLSCEARTLAELIGEWNPPPSEALLVGSFVDEWFTGPKSFERFVSEHPEIVNSRTGEFKAPFKRAIEMIERARADPVFMEYMRGQKQKIVTGEIDRIPFKAKFDVFRKNERIVDLKTTRSMEPMYKAGQGKLSPVEYWGWDLQMAIYSFLEGHDLPTYLAIITKEDPPNLFLIEITREQRQACMELVRAKLPRLDAIKRGLIEPERCENCAYCRATKRITRPITLDELNMEL